MCSNDETGLVKVEMKTIFPGFRGPLSRRLRSLEEADDEEEELRKKRKQVCYCYYCYCCCY